MIRFRITFAKTDRIRYIGHLDIYHSWIRTLRRAHLEVVHSQGFHQQPKIHLASALSLGYTGSHEYLECWLEQDLTRDEIWTKLEPVMHPGMRLVEIELVDLKDKPLQVQICGAEYNVSLPAELLPGLGEKVSAILAQPEILLDRKGKQVDIRKFIFDIQLNQADNLLTMHLSAGEGTTGRVDEVLGLLQIDPLDCLVERTRIELQ